MKELENRIQDKLDNDIALEPKDIVSFGKALNLGPMTSRKPVYKLLLQNAEKEKFHTIKRLVQEIEKEEPFDNMPDEVKPSLHRITQLIEKQDATQDKHLLLPIHRVLTKYVELESERDKFKNRAKWASILTFVSLIMGAFSFYQSLQSPSSQEIKAIMTEVISEKQKLSNNENSLQEVQSLD